METSNTRTLLPLSNIVDTETFSSKSFANSTSAIDAVNRESLLEDASLASSKSGIGMVVESVMNSYLGPRLLLAAVACLYGTNFPLGSIMDHALPASAATSARMVFAAAALSPFIRQIPRELIGMSLLAGCFTASGYVTQSMALVDTSPATVSFLGAATVIWCPFLEWLLHKTPMGWKDRPQTWVSAFLCLLGVGILELCGSDAANTFSSIGIGDGLALLQAMGFGTGLFLSEQMMKKHPTKALPITSVLVATTAFIAMVWSLCDGWIGTAPGWESMTLPNLLIDPSMREVALAVVWTGVISTSLNFFLEIFSLGKVPSGEASVILATEPLWAAAFASLLLGEEFGWNDYVGGFLIVAACIANSRKPSDFGMFFSSQEDKVSP
jgi:drug/metabolite transporter (DMT)-like permease